MKIAFENIEVRFGRVHALAGVDVVLRPGETTVLVGPNGAGKSTLLGVLLGLIKPHSGTLRMDDQVLPLGSSLPISFRERLGYLPEAVAFAETLTGRQVMSFFARARGVAKSQVDVVLERVGLGPASRRSVGGYSRGMRQRLGLGIAILSEPELLVLDEPTGGLDQQGLALLWEVLAAWKEAGRTVVLTTHDLALIERRADQLYVFSEGRVLASGSPAALRREVDLPVTLRLELDDAAVARGLAARLNEQLGLPTWIDVPGEVSMKVQETGLFGALQYVNGEATHVVRTRVEAPGLDEVYARLMEVSP